MSDVTSYDIKEALAKKHRGEFFMTEVKNGPTGVATGQLLQFDAVAIYKSWSNQQIRGYEIKISRSDFLRDAKYPRYLSYFHEFYFIVPQGMVKREEIDESIGLMWYNPDTGAITTKKKPILRKIEIDADFLLYIIMNRLDSDRAPFMLHKGEAFRAWFNEKETNKELAYRVKSKLLEDNVALEAEIRRLQRYKEAEEKLNSIMAVLAKHGIRGTWRAEEALDAALSSQYPPELSDVRAAAQQTLAKIDKLIFAAERKEPKMKIERITRPTVDAEPGAARFIGKTNLFQNWPDSVINIVLNGPTCNGVNKDEIRAMLRQTYGALKGYERIGPLASPFLNDAAAVVAMAFSDLYPDKAYEAQISPTILTPDGQQACGCTTFPDADGDLPLVEISGQLPIVHLPEILAHELAHVASGTIGEHGPEWEDAFGAIHSKYDEISVVLFGELSVEDVAEGVTPHEIGDGGIIAMPLKANVPEPTHDDWKPTTCSICGAECWETGIAREAMAAEPELTAACTPCALKAGSQKQGGDK